MRELALLGVLGAFSHPALTTLQSSYLHEAPRLQEVSVASPR